MSEHAARVRTPAAAGLHLTGSRGHAARIDKGAARCPRCRDVLERASHTVRVTGAERFLLTSCCGHWVREDALRGLGIVLSADADDRDDVVISPHEVVGSLG